MAKGLNFLKRNWQYVLVALVIFYFWIKKKDEKDGSAPDDVVVNKQNLSYSWSQYVLYADSIYQNLGLGDNWNPYEYDEEVGEILKRMNTDDDYYELVVAFGNRENVLFSDIDLPQAISTLLDDDVKEEVNQNWSSKNMITRL